MLMGSLLWRVHASWTKGGSLHPAHAHTQFCRVQRVASSADADKACERERIALQACTRKMVRGLLACAQFAADER